MTVEEIEALMEAIDDAAALTREMGEVLLVECDTLLRAEDVLAMYPQIIPNKRWIYTYQKSLGAVRVPGRRSLRFPLRKVRQELGV